MGRGRGKGPSRRVGGVRALLLASILLQLASGQRALEDYEDADEELEEDEEDVPEEGDDESDSGPPLPPPPPPPSAGVAPASPAINSHPQVVTPATTPSPGPITKAVLVSPTPAPTYGSQCSSGEYYLRLKALDASINDPACLERGTAHSYLEAVVGSTRASTKTIYNNPRPAWNQYLDLGCQVAKDKITVNLVDVMHSKSCFTGTFEKWSSRTAGRRTRRGVRGLVDNEDGSFTHAFTRMSKDGRIKVNMQLDVYPGGGQGGGEDGGGDGSNGASLLSDVGGNISGSTVSIIASIVSIVVLLTCCLCCVRYCSRRKKQGGRNIHLSPGPSPIVNLPEPSAPPMVPGTPLAVSMRPGFAGGDAIPIAPVVGVVSAIPTVYDVKVLNYTAATSRTLEATYAQAREVPRPNGRK